MTAPLGAEQGRYKRDTGTKLTRPDATTLSQSMEASMAHENGRVMAPCVRLYREALHNPRIVGLSNRSHRVWTCCLLIADDAGRLPKLADVAFHARMPAADIEAAFNELIEAELIRADGTLHLNGWGEWVRREPLRPSGSEWASIRTRIFVRDNYTCRYCNVRGVHLECDHVIPVARGGSHEDDNLVTACKPCNRAKHARVVSIEEWQAVRRGAA